MQLEILYPARLLRKTPCVDFSLEARSHPSHVDAVYAHCIAQVSLSTTPDRVDEQKQLASPTPIDVPGSHHATQTIM